MCIINKTYKIRLYPNNKQRTLLEKSSNISRWAYNYSLDKKKEYYKEYGKSLSEGDIRKEITKLKREGPLSWLYEYSNDIVKQAVKDCGRAFSKLNKIKLRIPIIGR